MTGALISSSSIIVDHRLQIVRLLVKERQGGRREGGKERGTHVAQKDVSNGCVWTGVHSAEVLVERFAEAVDALDVGKQRIDLLIADHVRIFLCNVLKLLFVHLFCRSFPSIDPSIDRSTEKKGQ